MLTVLWVMTGVSLLVMAATLVARESVAAARNRSNLHVAGWMAEGCVARARAAIDIALADSSLTGTPDPRSAWGGLDAAISGPISTFEPDCEVTIAPAGLRMDVNRADARQLRRVFRQAGISGPRADSLADATLDWIDVDDQPRTFGAERQWYIANNRFRPRNAFFVSVDELQRVRGLDKMEGLDSMLSVEPGRVLLERAPLSVLALLSGFTDELLAVVAARRARGIPLGDPMEVSASLSRAAADSLAGATARLFSEATREPDAWIVLVVASVGSPAVDARIELRLVRAGHLAVIVRRRVWG